MLTEKTIGKPDAGEIQTSGLKEDLRKRSWRAMANEDYQ